MKELNEHKQEQSLIEDQPTAPPATKESVVPTTRFKFKDEVADKELIHSMNHQVYELKGAGVFECTPIEWDCVFSRMGLFELDGE